MKKVKCFIPNDVKKKIREYKEQLNAIARQEVSRQQSEYDDFVRRVEGTTTLHNTDKSEGLTEIMELLERCVPDKFLDKIIDEVRENLANPEFRQMCIDQYVEGARINLNIHINKEGATMEGLAKTDTEGLLKMYREWGKVFYITNARFDNDFINNFYQFVANKDKIAVFTYYYLTFEHGYMKIARMLPKLLLTEEYGYRFLLQFNYMVGSLVSLSTSFGSEDKKSWSEFAESIAEESEELWKEIVSTLRYVIENKGQKKSDVLSLQDMLIGDKEELLLGIEQFLKENEEAIALAYLLRALERTYHIECPSFRVFCNAVNLHFGRNIGFRKGLDRYNDIKNYPLNLKKPEGKSWIKAKETIDTWAKIFSNCA